MPSERGAAGPEQEPVLKGEEEPDIEEGAIGRGIRGAQQRYDFPRWNLGSKPIQIRFENILKSWKFNEFYK